MKKTTVVEPIVFGYMFCRYLMLPVEDQLIYTKCCRNAYNATFCNVLHTNSTEISKSYQNVVQERAAEWKIYTNIIRCLPAAFMTVIYANWSDYVGRKSVLILPIIGDTILAMSMVLNSHYIDLPVYIMLIGVFISSMCGNFVLVLSASFCYVADATSISKRTQRNIILESMVYLAGATSNLAGGQILYRFGFVPVYGLAFFMFICQIIYWFFIDESYSPGVFEGKKKFYQLFKLETFRNTFQILTKARDGKKQLKIWLLFACFFFAVLLFVSYNSVMVFYLLHEPLNFAPTQIGYFLAEAMSLKFLGSLIIDYILVHRLHLKDYFVIIISFVTFGGLFLSIGLSYEEWHIYSSAVWALGAGVAIAVIRGKLSKLVATDEYGRLFSIISCVEVLVAMFTGITTTSIYKATVSFNPSVVFYILSGLTIIPIALNILLSVIDSRKNIKLGERQMLFENTSINKIDETDVSESDS